MNVSFTPTGVVAGMRKLTLTVTSTSPLADVLASSTPAQAGIVVVGQPSCTGVTGAINASSRTLTITLGSSCTLVANVPVTVAIPAAFFAPNPAAGTTVILAIATDVANVPSAAAGYITGSSMPLQCILFMTFSKGVRDPGAIFQ